MACDEPDLYRGNHRDISHMHSHESSVMGRRQMHRIVRNGTQRRDSENLARSRCAATLEVIQGICRSAWRRAVHYAHHDVRHGYASRNVRQKLPRQRRRHRRGRLGDLLVIDAKMAVAQHLLPLSLLLLRFAHQRLVTAHRANADGTDSAPSVSGATAGSPSA